MKRITILAATLFALSGLQAQTGIDGVLRNIETNNKELQANAQLIASQKLETRTDNNLPDPTLSYAHLWNNKDKNNTTLRSCCAWRSVCSISLPPSSCLSASATCFLSSSIV